MTMNTGSQMAKTLREKIDGRGARIGVIGLGYVGLPLALRFAEQGYQVIGFDTDHRKPPLLASGQSYLRHIPSDRVKAVVATGRLESTTDHTRLGEADVVIVCVPTPLTPNREPDMQFVVSAASSIARTLRRGQLIVLESSTYPGTTREVVLPALAATGLAPGEDFFVAYSPEREDPGRTSHTLADIPKIVGGLTPECRSLATGLYSSIVLRAVPVSSMEVAEAAKILENTYRAVNVALVNEMKLVLDRMGIDVWEVIDAAATKPFGFQPFYPGPGLGGHCIPIDPFYLTWKAREYGITARFIELAGEVNTAMPEHVVTRLADALNEKERAIRGSRVLVLGVAYKPGVDDMRESPALEIIEMLRQKGAHVDYHDPFVPNLPATRRHNIEASSISLTSQRIASYDAVVITTDHDPVDYALVAKSASLIVDTRNALARRGIAHDNVVKA